jgi:PAS domain S-box-containing protein
MSEMPDITKRDESEKALVEQRTIELQRLNDKLSALASIVESSGDAILSHSLDGTIQSWNKGAENLYGWEAAEVLGRCVSLLLPEEKAQESAAIYEKIKLGQPVRNHESVGVHKDGKLIHVSLTISPIKDPQGRIVGAAKIARDITGRKRAEEVLLESQAFLQSTLDALSAHIAILDETGTIIAVNAAWRNFAQANGLSGDVFALGKNYLQVCDEATTGADTRALAEGIRHVMAGTREEFYLEYACHSPTERRWFDVRVTRFQGEGPLRVVVDHENITARKFVEESHAEQMRIAAFSAEVGVALNNAGNTKEMLQRCADATLEHLEAGFARIWIYNKENALELQADAGVYTHLDGPDSDVSLGELKIGLIAQSRKPLWTNDVAIDPRIQVPEWARREGLITFAGYPLIVEDRLIGVMAIGPRTPLSEFALSALGSTADNIALGFERKRSEMKRKQVEQQLRQADKMASIGLLAAGVAHEINNPIGFVKSNLSSLEDYTHSLLQVIAACETIQTSVSGQGRVDAQLQQVLDELAMTKKSVGYETILSDIPALLNETKDGIERVRTIVQNLKEFSHADDGQQKHADINECLRSTLNLVSNELKYKAEVVQDYGQLPEILCRPRELNQVFMNLLVNAAQAITSKGQIRIHTLHYDEHIIVEISDTGKGILPEHMDSIFEPFFTTKEVGTGTGLGLSISYGIIQKHRGRMEVESVVGKGTTFRIWLPANTAPEPVGQHSQYSETS